MLSLAFGCASSPPVLERNLHFVNSSPIEIHGGATLEKATEEYVVEGQGETIELAKLDAVRAALNLAANQLVFAEREILNDAIVRDVIISTMNGYISNIRIIHVSGSVNSVFHVILAVKVSESALGNFTSRFGAQRRADDAPSSVPADQIAIRLAGARETLQANRIKKQHQWKMAQVIAKDLFRGYPKNATKAAVDSVEFSSDSPASVDIQISYDFSPTYKSDLSSRIDEIDRLIRDAGKEESSIRICPVEGELFPTDRCRIIPPGGEALRRLYGLAEFRGRVSGAVRHLILVPYYNESGSHRGCLAVEIDGGAIPCRRDLGLGSYSRTCSQVEFRPSKFPLGRISQVAFSRRSSISGLGRNSSSSAAQPKGAIAWSKRKIPQVNPILSFTESRYDKLKDELSSVSSRFAKAGALEGIGALREAFRVPDGDDFWSLAYDRTIFMWGAELESPSQQGLKVTVRAASEALFPKGAGENLYFDPFMAILSNGRFYTDIVGEGEDGQTNYRALCDRVSGYRARRASVPAQVLEK